MVWISIAALQPSPKNVVEFGTGAQGLTIPSETDRDSPNGLPNATTRSPVCGFFAASDKGWSFLAG